MKPVLSPLPGFVNLSRGADRGGARGGGGYTLEKVKAVPTQCFSLNCRCFVVIERQQVLRVRAVCEPPPRPDGVLRRPSHLSPGACLKFDLLIINKFEIICIHISYIIYMKHQAHVRDSPLPLPRTTAVIATAAKQPRGVPR